MLSRRKSPDNFLRLQILFPKSDADCGMISSKVIFLPATNQTVQQQLAQADTYGEGPSSQGQSSKSSNGPFMGDTNDGFQQAMNARVIENI